MTTNNTIINYSGEMSYVLIVNPPNSEEKKGDRVYNFENEDAGIVFSGWPGYAVMRVLGVFQNFYAVIFIMRLCGYPHNFVS